MLLAFGLITNELGATEWVESIVWCTITSQKRVVGQLVLGLRAIELDLAIVDSVTCLALVAHWVWISHVKSRTIANETFHRLIVHLGLIQAREGGNFDLRIKDWMGFQTERLVSWVTSVPKVVAHRLSLHIDTVCILVSHHLQLFVESKKHITQRIYE